MAFLMAKDGDGLDRYILKLSGYISSSLPLLVVYEKFWKLLVHRFQLPRTTGEEGGGGRGFKMSGHPQPKYFARVATMSAQRPYHPILASLSYQSE